MSQERQEQETKKNFVPKIIFGAKTLFGPKIILDSKFFRALRPKFFFGPNIFFLDRKFCQTKKMFQTDQNIFLNPKLPSMKDDLWREKTELLNLSLSKMARAKVLLELEFDTENQVLLNNEVAGSIRFITT